MKLNKITATALIFAVALVFACGGSNSPNQDPGTQVEKSPKINIKQGSINIANIGSCYLGSTISSAPKDVTFTIENKGTANLALTATGTNYVAIAGNAGDTSFSVLKDADSPVAPGGSTTFIIRFDPATTGDKTADVSIENNDGDENPYSFTVAATCTLVPEPEINIMQGNTNIAESSGSFDFGTVLTGASRDITFTIENTGSDDLELTETTGYAVIDGDTSFSIQKDADPEVAPGGSTTFIVRFNPVTKGDKTASISIGNSDIDKDPYIFSISGTGTISPEINIKQNSINIANGGAFDFGSTTVSLPPKNITFTIENKGVTDLLLTGAPVISISGDLSSFSAAQPGQSVIAANASTDFTVTFNPASTGAKTATISIASNDSDENPYTFTITGTGTPSPEPEINIIQGSINIADGGAFDFGSITVSLPPKNITFTIENKGSVSLDLAAVTISGAGASSFSATQAGTPVIAGGNTTFTIEFNPESTGAKTAELSIGNNDSDENPYSFIITGTGTPSPEPEINIIQGSINIADGGAFDFGSTEVATENITFTKSVIFTIQNTGSAALTLASPVITGADAGSFSVINGPGITVSAGGSTTFVLRFHPSTICGKTASLSIVNNDSNENPYNITVTGAVYDEFAFVTVWKTDNSGGSTASNQVKLPLASVGTYNFTAYWGDGSSNTITAYNQAEATHTYASAGTYTVTIRGQIEGFGFQPSGEDNVKFVDVLHWGQVKLSNGGRQFIKCTNLAGFSANDNPDLREIIDMSLMFSNASSFNGNISGWDTSTVMFMFAMFNGAVSFNGDISGWDTSNVRSMSMMFSEASSFNGNISGWDTSNVSDMLGMFQKATSFNQDLSSWSVGSVTSHSSFDAWASSWTLPRPNFPPY